MSTDCDPEGREYWEAVIKTELMIQRSRDSDKFEKLRSKTRLDFAQGNLDCMKYPNKKGQRMGEDRDYQRLLVGAIAMFPDGDYEEAEVWLHNELVRRGCDPNKPEQISATTYSGIMSAMQMNTVEAKKQQRRKDAQLKKEEPKPVSINLFAKLETSIAEPETGEVVAPSQEVQAQREADELVQELEQSEEQRTEAERIKLEVAEALGFDKIPKIETRQDVDWALSIRLRILQEFVYLTVNYNELKETLQNDLASWERLFQPMLGDWLINNPPAKGKTHTELHGTIGHRNQPASISYAEEDDTKPLYQAWLKSLPKKVQELIGVQKLERFTCDNQKMKDYLKANIKDGVLPNCNNAMKYKPAEENKLTIGPALDTIKKHITAGKYTTAQYTIPVKESAE